MLLFGLVTANLIWMHVTIRRMDLARHPDIREDTDLPAMLQAPAAAGRR
jgi:hypothetical protein